MKYYLLFLLSFCASNLLAQNKLATTDDGKRVILKTNGTWEYVKSDPKTQPTYLTSPSPKPQKPANRTINSTSNARTYIRGPRGGCYYINRNGGKTYVDRSMCN